MRVDRAKDPIPVRFARAKNNTTMQPASFMIQGSPTTSWFSAIICLASLKAFSLQSLLFDRPPNSSVSAALFASYTSRSEVFFCCNIDVFINETLIFKLPGLPLCRYCCADFLVLPPRHSFLWMTLIIS